MHGVLVVMVLPREGLYRHWRFRKILALSLRTRSTHSLSNRCIRMRHSEIAVEVSEDMLSGPVRRKSMTTWSNRCVENGSKLRGIEVTVNRCRKDLFNDRCKCAVPSVVIEITSFQTAGGDGELLWKLRMGTTCLNVSSTGLNFRANHPCIARVSRFSKGRMRLDNDS